MSRRNRKSNVANVETTIAPVDDASNVEHIDTIDVDHDAPRDDVSNTSNAIDALTNVANAQRNDDRTRDVNALLHALYNDESLTSRDRKTIRRTLRDKYDFYISRERKHASSSNVVSRILNASNAS